MQDARKKARDRVKSRCKVCPVCNGVACAGDVPGMGGIGTGVSFQNNVTALAQQRLLMRVLHGANEPDTTMELWGRKLALPVLAAPVGSVSVNLGSDMSDADYATTLVRGCRAAGTLASVGDGLDAATFEKNISMIGDGGASVIAFIKPWAAREEIVTRLDMAVAAGISICGMDVDAAGLTVMRRRETPVSTQTPEALAQVVKLAHARGIKFIVKGVMAEDEAVIAADAGADAVLVSNHGGRVLDHSPGTAEVLPDIADAVGGRVVVMMDGGVRTGADVLKALALGAHLTLICRPVVVAVHGDEQNGVVKYFAQLQDELAQAMRLTGCGNLAAVSRRVLAEQKFS
jgi:isopentenyl diphosphate isomerase/L-lactate dehydrogenase-like FMN-dependent dehydrogenase